MARTRRHTLASASALLAAFSAERPFRDRGKVAGKGEDLATLEYYATATFEPWEPGGAAMIGPPAEWAGRLESDYAIVRLAIAVMEHTPEQLAARAGTTPEQLQLDFLAALQDVTDRYRAIATASEGALVRLMCGMARHCRATGQV